MIFNNSLLKLAKFAVLVRYIVADVQALGVLQIKDMFSAKVNLQMLELFKVLSINATFYTDEQ